MNKFTFLSCLIILISVNTMGQQRVSTSDSLLYSIFPVEVGHVTYQKVIEVPGKLKGDIYKVIKAWAASAFVSQKDALQSDDLNTGLVIYKFNFPSSFESPKIDGVSTIINTTYWQNLKFYIKDGRLKVVIDNIKVDIEEGGSYYISTYTVDSKEIAEKAIKDYKKSMKVTDKMESKMRDNAARYDQEVFGNFKVADKEIKEIIASIEKSMKSGKSEFDF